MKDGAILGFIMAGQTKTEDTTIKPILPTQTDWHDDTKLRALYRALPVLQPNKFTVLQRFYRILVEHYFPFNDAIAEEMPYEQLPDFVESERPINRPEIRKAMLYIEKNIWQTSVAQKDFGTYSFKVSPTSLRFLKKMIQGFQ